MKVSAAGRATTRHFEGCKLTAYLDTGGIPTIGYGSTGPHIHLGQIITQAQADAMFELAVDLIESGLNHHIRTQLTQGQFDALADFGYNVGLGRMYGSAMFHYVQIGELAAAATQFPLWVYGKDKTGAEVKLEWQVTRRAVELQMWQGHTWSPA